MIYKFLFYLPLVALLPAILAVKKFPLATLDYRPFFLLVWLRTINVILSFVLLDQFSTNTYTNNIYVLFESLVILYQFWRWKLFQQNKPSVYILYSLLMVFWLTENFGFSGLEQPCAYFKLVYSFVMVILSITQINNITGHSRLPIERNPIFIICFAFIILYIMTILREVLDLYVQSQNGMSLNNEILFFNLSEVFTNVFFGIAILKMPLKRSLLSITDFEKTNITT